MYTLVVFCSGKLRTKILKYFRYFHHYILTDSLSDLCMPKGRDFFNENLLKEIHVHQFYNTPKLSRSLGMGMKFTVSCVLTQQMLQTKFGKDWTSSS